MKVLGIALVCAIMLPSAVVSGPATPASDYYLSAADVIRLRKSALNNGVAAANRLSKYYSIYENDHYTGEFWLKVSAELGDCDAIMEIMYRVSSVENVNKNQLAYWHKRKSDFAC